MKDAMVLLVIFLMVGCASHTNSVDTTVFTPKVNHASNPDESSGKMVNAATLY